MPTLPDLPLPILPDLPLPILPDLPLPLCCSPLIMRQTKRAQTTGITSLSVGVTPSSSAASLLAQQQLASPPLPAATPPSPPQLLADSSWITVTATSALAVIVNAGSTSRCGHHCRGGVYGLMRAVGYKELRALSMHVL